MAPLAGGGLIGLLAFAPGRAYVAVYAVSGLAGAITLVLCLFLPRAEESRHGSEAWKDTFRTFRSVISDKTILITCAVEAAILFAYGTFETFLPLYSVSLGISPYEVGIFLSAQVITLAMSKPVMGRFSDRHGRRPQIFFGALMGALCIGSLSFCSSFIPLLGISIAFGMSLSIVTSATLGGA